MCLVMKSGQFYRGKIDGIQKHFESQGIGELLPPEKLQDLADTYEIGEYPHFFKTEFVLSRTVIASAEDSDGRGGGITNHTILHQFDRYSTHENEQYVFDVDAFILEIQAGKRRLKMPPVPKLPNLPEDLVFGIIDLPPPLEWEV